MTIVNGVAEDFVGVPDKVAVPFLLFVNLTPAGSTDFVDSVAWGSFVVNVIVPAVPTENALEVVDDVKPKTVKVTN